MKIETLPLEKARIADFYRVHSKANGADWCFCTAWWVPTWEGWGDRTAEENRAFRDSLFAQGMYDGYLLYADDEPVGWCQCGKRDRLTKLVESHGLQPDSDVIAITCFFIAPRYRGHELAHRLLQGVLRDLQNKGEKRVQAFPCHRQGLPPEDVWTGPESLYQQAGFRRVKKCEKRTVMELRLFP